MRVNVFGTMQVRQPPKPLGRLLEELVGMPDFEGTSVEQSQLSAPSDDDELSDQSASTAASSVAEARKPVATRARRMARQREKQLARDAEWSAIEKAERKRHIEKLPTQEGTADRAADSMRHRLDLRRLSSTPFGHESHVPPERYQPSDAGSDTSSLLDVDWDPVERNKLDRQRAQHELDEAAAEAARAALEDTSGNESRLDNIDDVRVNNDADRKFCEDLVNASLGLEDSEWAWDWEANKPNDEMDSFPRNTASAAPTGATLPSSRYQRAHEGQRDSRAEPAGVLRGSFEAGLQDVADTAIPDMHGLSTLTFEEAMQRMMAASSR